MSVVLWHLPVSHYSEKVRWALDWKGVNHERRTAMPGAHMAVAAWLTRGRHRTLPVLRLGDRTIGDSTAIIAALEETQPGPLLYPADAGERRRALALEEWFDENLGPHIRRFVFHDLSRNPELMRQLSVQMAPGPLRRFPRMAGAYGTTFVGVRYGAGSDRRSEEARRRVLEAFDFLESELAGGDHLVGDTFTVADLTAASLFYPLVLPPEGPRYLASKPPELERLTAPLADRPGYQWVAETFRRYRRR
jgi:glutathione S-transferase